MAQLMSSQMEGPALGKVQMSGCHPASQKAWKVGDRCWWDRLQGYSEKVCFFLTFSCFPTPDSLMAGNFKLGWVKRGCQSKWWDIVVEERHRYAG